MFKKHALRVCSDFVAVLVHAPYGAVISPRSGTAAMTSWQVEALGLGRFACNVLVGTSLVSRMR